jgi:hypothetical protein
MKSSGYLCCINAISDVRLHAQLNAQDKAHRNPHELIGKQKED